MVSDSRIKLHHMLKEIIKNDNVYYQPPSSISIDYPAIIYTRNRINNIHANNKVYAQNHSYLVTVIDSNPDSKIVDDISKLAKCEHTRNFKVDNMNHDVFVLYFD